MAVVVNVSFDEFKKNADLWQMGWLGSYVEIWINNPKVQLKESKECRRLSDRSFAVTAREFKKLDKKYTIAPDW